MIVAESCEEILEFLWESEFGQSYQIPDSFWDTPLGFAIYEVIGRVPNSPDVGELSSAQAAKFLGITQPSLERLTNEGRIPCSREAGGHVRYRVSDLQQARESLPE